MMRPHVKAAEDRKTVAGRKASPRSNSRLAVHDREIEYQRLQQKLVRFSRDAHLDDADARIERVRFGGEQIVAGALPIPVATPPGRNHFTTWLADRQDSAAIFSGGDIRHVREVLQPAGTGHDAHFPPLLISINDQGTHAVGVAHDPFRRRAVAKTGNDSPGIDLLLALHKPLAPFLCVEADPDRPCTGEADVGL